MENDFQHNWIYRDIKQQTSTESDNCGELGQTNSIGQLQIINAIIHIQLQRKMLN